MSTRSRIQRELNARIADDAFHRVADARWAALMVDGKTVPLDQARAWLEARARGERAARPEARISVL